MNWLLIVVIAILGGMAFLGYKKGLVQMLFAVGSLVVAIILTGFLGPIFADSLCESEVVMNYATESVNSTLGIETKMDNAIDNVTTKKTKGYAKLSKSDQNKVIKNLGLPSLLDESLVDSTAEYANQEGKITPKRFSNCINEMIARMMIRGIVYAVIFIIIRIILRILLKTFIMVEKRTGAYDVNELTGAAAGLLVGCLIVWVGFLILLSFSATEFGIECYRCINDSEVLRFIYNNNLLLKWILLSLAK